MQRLNIPLHRYQQTTRLPRRVVSLFVGLAGCAAVLTALSAAIWFGRDTVSASAPQGTALVLHIRANRLTWNVVTNTLGDFTLVSNRPLTARDLQSFVSGEFSVFFGTDGSRSVAVRMREDDIPMELFDSIGVIVSETRPGVYLLSDRPTASMDWEPDRIWFGMLHTPGKWRIGNVHVVSDEGIRGPVYASQRQVSVRLPSQHLSKSAWDGLPDNHLLSLATPALTSADVKAPISAFVTQLPGSIGASSESFANSVLSHSGDILLTNSPDGLSYLFTSDDPSLGGGILQRVMRETAANHAPTTRDFDLPDLSTATELIVDPSLLTIEETTVNGLLVTRVTDGSGGYVYGGESKQTYVLSNSLDLLDFGLNDGAKTDSNGGCYGNSMNANLSGLSENASFGSWYRNGSIFTEMGSEYKQLVVDQGMFHTIIRMCR